jgi:alginate O-acetyltransferase complex protein AlgJ
MRTAPVILATLLGLSIPLSALMPGSQAQKSRPSLSIGKDSFVFDKLEDFREYGAGAQRRTDRELEIIGQINRALAGRNVQLAMVFVPSVMRVYEDRLPSTFRLTDTLRGLYSHSLDRLRADRVFVPDLNAAFLKARGATGGADAQGQQHDFPLFMRQDNHWSTLGAMLAAETVAASIKTELRPRLDGLRELNSSVEWREPIPFVGNYYRNLSTEDRAKIVQDRLRPVAFTRDADGELLGDETPRIALTGSSFSHQKEFGFSEALSHFLRRDVLNASESGKGFWTPLRDYLASDAFQQHPPTLLIWEMPEDHLAPGYPPIDWAAPEAKRQFLLEVGANLTGDCGASGLKPRRVSGVDFTGDPASVTLDSRGAESFVQFEFDGPIRADQYLSVRATSAKADSFTLERDGTAKISGTLEGFGEPHQLNLPLAALSDGTTGRLSVRVAAGSELRLESAKLCAVPNELGAAANPKK